MSVDIGNMQYGTDPRGVSAYLEEIHSGALQKAKSVITDEISSIESVCDKHWEGEAKAKFIANLRKDGEHVNEQFDALYGILCETVNSASAAMVSKDRVLID